MRFAEAALWAVILATATLVAVAQEIVRIDLE